MISWKKTLLCLLLLILLALVVYWWVFSRSDPQNKASLPPLTQYNLVLEQDKSASTKLAPFWQRLAQDGFVLTPLTPPFKEGFTHCQTNEEYIFSGSGVSQFYFKREKPIKISSGNVYPDFSLTIFTFSSAEQALTYADKIALAHRYNSDNENCLGYWHKTPWKVVANGKWVFYFQTRAEMLRDFTEKYGEVAQKLVL